MSRYPTSEIVRSTLLRAAVALVALAVCASCDVNEDVHAAGDRYLNLLRSGEQDAAYQMLAAERQGDVSRSAFDGRLASGPLAKSTSHTWDHSTKYGAKSCVKGDVVIGDQEHGLTLYFLREAEQWKVHTVYFDRRDFSDEPWQCGRTVH